MLFSANNPPQGYYVYLYLRHDGTPYYVGKGTKRRAWYKNKNELRPPKDKSRIVIVSHKLLEHESFLLEIELIKQYGRKDLGTGILWNLTDGGEGVTLIGSSHPKYSKTIYSFAHADGTHYVGTQYDFRIKYDINAGHLSQMIKGNVFSVKGWVVLDENGLSIAKPSPQTLTIHLVHDTHGHFIGTKKLFRKTYNEIHSGILAKLLAKNPGCKSHRGWRLPD